MFARPTRHQGDKRRHVRLSRHLLPAALDELKTDNPRASTTDRRRLPFSPRRAIRAERCRPRAMRSRGKQPRSSGRGVAPDAAADRIALDGRRVWLQDPDRTYLGPDVTLEPGVRLYPGVHLEGGERTWRRVPRSGPMCSPPTRSLVVGRGSGTRCCAAPCRQRLRGGALRLAPPGEHSARPVQGGDLRRDQEAPRWARGPRSPPHLPRGHPGGRDANIGAGTITCNYDGYRKSRTVVGASLHRLRHDAGGAGHRGR